MHLNSFSHPKQVVSPISRFLILATSRKRRPLDETHFCHICNRALTHSHDKIVFCDNCDTPYHQLCHQPPVSDATVNSNNKWFCSSCKPPPMVESFTQRLVGQGLSVGAVTDLILLC